MLVSTYATGQAKTQKIFPIDVEDSTIAIVRMYQDKTLLVKYDEDDRHIKSFFIRNNDNHEYKNEEVGPLIYDRLK